MNSTTIDSVKPTLSLRSAREVCGLMGELAVKPEATLPGKQLGTVTLLPHQIDAVVRLREIIEKFSGALLADHVGLGKTFVALALSREYRSAHVLAPAALLPMWRSAIARCELAHIALHSLHSASRCVPDLRSEHKSKCLVIIDESHHLRNVTTARYRNVSEAVSGFDLLLLSATPVHNTPNDLRSLLALFLGNRSDLIEPSILGRLIVRRLKHPAHAKFPRVIEHDPLVVPHYPGTLAGIVSLPSPLPASDGTTAGALIRLGLLRAWCSSDAALTYALDRRLLRGEALRQALAEGRHPTNVELRSWLVGDHEVQLAFPLLMAAREVEQEPLAELLEIHLAAVRSLRSLHRKTACGDIARAQHLRVLRAKHSNAARPLGTSTVAFSQYTNTVKAIYRALSDIAGVGLLTGTHGRIASGAIARGEVLHSFAPYAHGKPPPPTHQAINLLLTTDLIAEGVNLQDAGVVVHLDLPWTDALRQQRVGRAARLGSLHSEVHVYTISPPEIANEVLRLSERLERKALFATCTVGSARNGQQYGQRLDASHDHHDADSRAHSPPHSPAEKASLMREMLGAWQERKSVPEDISGTESRVRGAPIGFREIPLDTPLDIPFCLLEGEQRQGLAAVDLYGTTKILAFHNDRWDDDISLIVDVMQVINRTMTKASQRQLLDVELELTTILRALESWTSYERNRADAGPLRDSMSDTSRELSNHIYKTVAGIPPIRRPQVSHAIDLAQSVAQDAHGAAAERAMRGWLRLAPTISPSEWLSSWRNWPALTNAVGISPNPVQTAPHIHYPRETTAVIRALILIKPQPG